MTNHHRVVFLLGLQIGLGFELTGGNTTAQMVAPKDEPPSPSTLRKLTGDDARRARELNQAIEDALLAGSWDEAIAQAEEMVAWRTKILGPWNYGVVSDEWRLRTLRRVSAMPEEDQKSFRLALDLSRRARTLAGKRKYAEAQPLYEEALGILRRILTDEHPDTAGSYEDLAVNLHAQGRYGQAQPLYERVLEIRRRVLTDEHAETARSYQYLASILRAQGKDAQAQTLHERDRRSLFACSLTIPPYLHVKLGFSLLGQRIDSLTRPRRPRRSKPRHSPHPGRRQGIANEYT